MKKSFFYFPTREIFEGTLEKSFEGQVEFYLGQNQISSPSVEQMDFLCQSRKGFDSPEVRRNALMGLGIIKKEPTEYYFKLRVRQSVQQNLNLQKML